MEKTAKTKEEKTVEKVKVNPLRNEEVMVRFVPRKMGNEMDQKGHVMEGGLADGAGITLCVPVLRSTGKYKNVLTNDEKDYLEEALGLEFNALSVYKTDNNYWDNYFVRLTKEGLRLRLSDPEDYIKYKVLLANNDIVAPSVEELQDRPKYTYRYVLVRTADETKLENARMDATMASYKEFGKIDNDFDTMRILVELMDGRPYDINSPAEIFRSRINQLIQKDARAFLRQIQDPLLHTKVILRRATELGKVSKRGDFYYLKSDNSPLCEMGEEPTLSIAARYLNLPAHQDIKFLLESEVDKNR